MSSHIVFFDGTCNLCNGFVDFLIGGGPSFSVAPLQGSTAQRVLPEHFTKSLSSVIYFREGEFFEESKAISWIFYDLGGVYKVLSYVLAVLPGFLTDGIYRFIAKRRYKIFGKRESCRLPSQEEQKFFLP